MKITTYEEKDIFPIIIAVLGICTTNFLCNIFKVIVDRDYPDLKGLVHTEKLDEASLSLINNVEAKWFHIVKPCIYALENTCISLANLYGVDEEAIGDDEEILDMAMEFLSHIIIDNFPRFHNEIEENTQEEEDFDDHTRQFSMSLIAVVNFLCKLITNKGAVNLNESWDHILEIADADFTGEEHFVALNMLKDCWIAVVTSFNALEDELDYKNKFN